MYGAYTIGLKLVIREGDLYWVMSRCINITYFIFRNSFLVFYSSDKYFGIDNIFVQSTCLSKRSQHDWIGIYWISLHEPGEPCHLSTPCRYFTLNWIVLHGMVLCVWSHIHQIHQGIDERTSNLFGGISVHGYWHPLFNYVGWNLCLITLWLQMVNQQKNIFQVNQTLLWITKLT